MKTSRHCEVRMQQRGISDLQIQLVKLFGEKEFIGQGAFKISLTRRSRKKLCRELRQLVELLESERRTLLIATDECLITAYNSKKRILRERKQRRLTQQDCMRDSLEGLNDRPIRGCSSEAAATESQSITLIDEVA